jgi:hypothetical protein
LPVKLSPKKSVYFAAAMSLSAYANNAVSFFKSAIPLLVLALLRRMKLDPTAHVVQDRPRVELGQRSFKQLRRKNQFGSNASQDHAHSTILSPQWGVVQNSFPTIQSTFTGPGISTLAHLTNTISPTLLNEFLFSYTTDHITLKNIDANGVTWQRPSGLTAGYLFNNGFGGKVPGIVIGGTNAAYGGFGFGIDPGYLPWHHSNPTYNFRDDLSKVVGKHTLQFGVQFVIFQRNELNQAVGANTGDQQGILTFSNVSSFNTKGNAFADFLLGEPTGTPGILEGGIKTFRQDSTQQNYYNRYRLAEPYFQDDWRVTSRLTLNLGLRMSLYGNWHEKYNNVYNWVPSVYNPSLASQLTVDPFQGFLLNGPPSVCTPPPGSNSSPCSPIPLNLTNLDPRTTNGLQRCGENGVPDGCMTSKIFNPAPRVGFAWDPWGDGKTSIRAGYGMFFHHGIGNEANTGSLEGSAPLVARAAAYAGSIGRSVADPARARVMLGLSR